MKKPEKELGLEEIAFTGEEEELNYLELPLSRQAFLLVAIVVILAGVVALSRAGFLNVLRGDFYTNRAAANANKEIILPAPRGIITDRYGEPLVENEGAFTVFVNTAELLKSKDRFENVMETLSGILNKERKELEKLIANADLEERVFVPVARNISEEESAAIKNLHLPAVQLVGDYSRYYPDGPAFGHVVGYVGLSEYSNDIIGKSGLETQYDTTLKGTDGSFIVYRDALGKELDTKVIEAPRTGNDLATTLDAELQRYFYNRLRNGLLALGRTAGAGIIINPQNGEILSLISLPSFDNNQVAEFLDNPGQPFFNRAISGAYTPGSSIKPLVALAALRENILDPKDRVFSAGSIEIPNPYDSEKPSIFLDWKKHGWVDIHSALAKSSNIYFYAIGGGLPKNELGIASGFNALEGLGINKLNRYWKTFLFGKETGIDLPSEGTGFLPNASEKEERTGQIWRIGDTYNVSIGQGDLLITPLQLINFIASIANGGHIYQPHLVRDKKPRHKYNKHKEGGVPPTAGQEARSKLLFDYSHWEEEISEIQKGMEDAVTKYYGTAAMLSGLPITSAGKTGSAQVANNTKTNAFFVGYAPAEDPEIAVLVLVEDAREGSLNAVPIARDVMEWYYYNRISKADLSL